jgi:predicted nucleotidyltransferase
MEGIRALAKMDADIIRTRFDAKSQVTRTMPKPAIILPMDGIRALCRQYRVKELALFGSALRDDFRPDSDLDFLVEFQPDARISLFGFSRLQYELEDLTHRRVDLVSKNGLKPLIRDAILREREILYAA